MSISGSGVAEFTHNLLSMMGQTVLLAIVRMVSGAILDQLVIKYQKQPTDITRGDFEDTTAGGSDLGIPELNVELRSVPIVAKTRKLKHNGRLSSHKI